MLFWILLILLLNGVVSFAYSVMNAGSTTTLWAMLAVNFVFFLGITQAGIIFSAILRISRASWGKNLCRLGEMLTLSFIPVAAITFLIIYFGGVDHIFYWASGKAPHGHGHLSPWVGRGIFFWRNTISMAVFYILSYAYFRQACREENSHSNKQKEGDEYASNLLAGFVIASYVVTNTCVAWDFGMMLMPHWDSSIFPPYYWGGNLFAGFAFLLILYAFFNSAELKTDTMALDAMGKVLFGFTLLWVYLFWSQYVVIWYGNQPELMGPLFRQMSGNYLNTFLLMMITGFIIPFFALLFRKIKLRIKGISLVAFSICTAIWINRYLMIIPVFTDGGDPLLATWTGVSLLLAGLSSTLLSVILFIRLFPQVKIVTSFRSDY